jgi:hypothetical protein
MEIIRPQPKTYRTRRRKPLAQAKSYRVVSEEVDGKTFRRTEFALRWTPWIMGGVLMVSVLIGLALVRKQWLSVLIANEACINQMLWTQPKDGWDTPEVDEDLLRLCYEREKMF